MNSLNSSDESIHISVNEPVKQGEGINAYISYKIHTETNRIGFKSKEFSVIRRYSDFVWLQSNLAYDFSGVIIPPLPEKLLVGRFSPEFIESRRKGLEKFLNRTATHPELRHSEHLRVFLEASEEGMTAFKNDSSSLMISASKAGLMQWIDETVQQISSTLGSGVVLEKTAVDEEIDAIQSYMDSLEPVVMELHKHAMGLSKRGREISDGLLEYGASFSLLGQSEGKDLGNVLSNVGGCADKLSALAAEQTEKEVIHFEEPILDYIRLLSSVKVALQKRADAKLTYETTVADLESKKSVRDKLRQKQKPGNEKLQQAEIEFAKAQERVDQVKKEFEVITQRVLREVERFKSEKLQDFRIIVMNYVDLQIAYNQKIEEEWRRIIPQLESIGVVDDTISSNDILNPE